MTLHIWKDTHSPAHDEKSASTHIYEDGIPDFAEATLESLYEREMTTMLRFGQYYPLKTAMAYVSRIDDAIDSLFVFEKNAAEIYVYIQQISITALQLVRFVRTVFAHFPDVRRIFLYAIDVPNEALPFPHQRLKCLEDITLALPGTPEAYLGMLGKKMSATIKRFNKKLHMDFAAVEKKFFVAADVPEDLICQIVEFNRMRMSGKGQTCYHTHGETQKMIALVKRYGIVCAVFIDGQLCAGMFSLRIGSTYCLQTLAHHPDYDRYNLGTLCCYYGIAHAIEQGGQRFNFGWGPYKYKYRLLGVHTDLYRIHIYRTPMALAADSAAVFKRALLTQRRNLKLWMGNPSTDESQSVRILRHTLNAVRALRANFRSSRTVSNAPAPRL